MGELARLVGVPPSTLRYYERVGLLDPAPRSHAGYRIYQPEAIGRVQFLLRAKALGLTLREVHRLLISPATDAAIERDRVRHLVAHKVADTRRRIAELQDLSLELESLYVRLLRAPGPTRGRVGDGPVWLPTDQEARRLSEEVEGCADLCCPNCACSRGEPCDCPDCPCYSRQRTYDRSA